MRVVVAMSGGVDSSVAAALLVDAGHDVVGVSMQLYDASQGEDRFGSLLHDRRPSRRPPGGARPRHPPLRRSTSSAGSSDVVVADFVREYASGRTPIPCAHCNSELKFSTLVDQAAGFGADRVATGHYARVTRDEAGD